MYISLHRARLLADRHGRDLGREARNYADPNKFMIVTTDRPFPFAVVRETGETIDRFQSLAVAIRARDLLNEKRAIVNPHARIGLKVEEMNCDRASAASTNSRVTDGASEHLSSSREQTMLETTNDQGPERTARRVRTMFRQPLAALAGALVLAATAFGGIAVANSGPVAGNWARPLLPGNPPIYYCIGFPFGGTPAGYPTGEVVAHTNVLQNDTRVHVTLVKGLPDTQYVVSIACQRVIGTFTTNDQGNGATNIVTPGVTTGMFGDPHWFVDVRVNNSWDDYRVAGPFGG
jgi:hypothetical protein